MNVVERARLKKGTRLSWRRKILIYSHYAHKAYQCKEEGVSQMIERLPLCYTYPSELTAKWLIPEPTICASPVWVLFLKDEILNAEVIK